MGGKRERVAEPDPVCSEEKPNPKRPCLGVRAGRFNSNALKPAWVRLGVGKGRLYRLRSWEFLMPGCSGNCDLEAILERLYRLRNFKCPLERSRKVTNINWHLEAIVGDVMKALADPDIHLIGVYGSNDAKKDALLERVNRKILWGNLFDPVLTVTVTKKHDMKKTREEIARQLGLTFNYKDKYERAQELIERRIKTKQKILIVLRDLHKDLDLRKLGIPYGPDNGGCKILLNFTTEDELSISMRPQKSFKV